MEKLKVVTAYFDKLRDDNDHTVYTEELITDVLNKIDLAQYEEVTDMPSSVVKDMLAEITSNLAPRLDNNQEQEILDFFEEILVEGKTEIPIIAKSLRYLLREDKSNKSALIVVDVQNDFISGALALQNSEEVVGVINTILEEHEFAGVFYSIDWHPEDHCSYITNVSKYNVDKTSPKSADEAQMFDKVIYNERKVLEQVMWPVHCQQGSEGAELHPDLNVVEGGMKIYKGQIPNVDSYSAFWDNGKLSRSELLGHLFDMDITHVFTCGLATDFCVGMTSLDSAEHGFDTFVLMDASRGVADESIDEMKAKMEKAGCELIDSSQIAEKMG